MGYLDNAGLAYLWSKIKAAFVGKQDKLTGIQGQIVGFDGEGNAVPQTLPSGGVTSFSGRTGAVTPQVGDYTAEMVGAATMEQVNTAIQAAILDSWGASY